ncbi:MAG: hypothetical protein ACQESS_06130 [Bacillota bacterium]
MTENKNVCSHCYTPLVDAINRKELKQGFLVCKECGSKVVFDGNVSDLPEDLQKELKEHGLA